MKRFALALASLFFGLSAAHAQNNWATPGGSQANGAVNMCLNGFGLAVPCGSAATPLAVTGSFSSAPFDNSTRGTPITATVAGQTGSLPATDTVVIQNVGAFPAWCQPGSLSTNITYGKLLSASGGQWAFARGAATDIFCEGIGGTTTINMQGGTGLAVDTGGGSGGSGSGAVFGTDAAGATPTKSPLYNAGLVRSGPINNNTWPFYSEGVVQPFNIDNDGNLRIETTDWTGTSSISTVTVTATFGTNTVSGLTAAEFTAGSIVVFTGGTVPTGLALNNPYVVITSSSTVATLGTLAAPATPLTWASGAQSTTAGLGLKIPVSDGMGAMVLDATFSGGGTLSFLSSPDGLTWNARNWLSRPSGQLSLTMSATNNGAFNIGADSFFIPYISTGTAGQTVTFGWHQSASPSSTALSSPLPNGGNTIGSVTQSGGPWTENLTQVNGVSSATVVGSGSLGACGSYSATPCALEQIDRFIAQEAGSAVPAGTNAIGSVAGIGTAAIAENVVAVGTSSTLIAAARTGVPGTGRQSITIVNTAQAVSLCLGNTGVTTSNGMCLPAIAGASLTLNTQAAIYGVWGDAGTHNVSFIETY